jgi:hypothetical protein
LIALLWLVLEGGNNAEGRVNDGCGEKGNGSERTYTKGRKATAKCVGYGKPMGIEDDSELLPEKSPRTARDDQILP